jgi:hypothetical protein
LDLITSPLEPPLTPAYDHDSLFKLFFRYHVVDQSDNVFQLHRALWLLWRAYTGQVMIEGGSKGGHG